MATYLELKSLFGEGPLVNKLEVAVCDKSRSILAEDTPSADRLAWASSALANSQTEAANLLKYVLVANKGLTLAQIQAATDAAIQTNVDTAVNKLHP